MRAVASAVFLLSALAAGGCGSDITPAAPSSGGSSNVATTYLARVLDTMQANSINRFKIDWISFRQTVKQAAPTPAAIPDVYPAISVALGLLDDHHSNFALPDGSRLSNPNRLPCLDPEVPTPSVPADIGYVRVGPFSGSGSAGVEFAADIQGRIAAADRAGVQGWVVDLRGNSGGTMWPMIAGLGPVLGEGTLGAFVYPDSQVHHFAYANGASTLAGLTQVQVLAPYPPVSPAPRVAVLTDCRVASAGEGTSIAFRGRPNTRSFGGPTRGISTANRAFAMTDGATLNLTVATMADRNLTRYGVPVVPDEVTGDAASTLERAIAWLRGR